MSGDEGVKPDPTSNDPGGIPATPDPVTARLDPGGLKGAHGRTGRMLQNAGLPFEEDEFAEAEGDDPAKLASGVDAGEDDDSDSSSSSSSSD